MSGVVIIGTGQGGFQAAASLRQEGHGGPITLIGDEPGLPYQRPPLSKAYLAGGDADSLILRPEGFYRRADIRIVPGISVQAIDRQARLVGAGGESIAYDHLILATGARNLRPPIPGLEAALDLRSLADAAALREAMSQPRRIAVIGGGFIGLEFGAVARKHGHQVALAEAAPRLMARAVSPAISARFQALHRDMGTAVHLGQPVVRVGREGIELADGRQIAADLVLLAAGVRPNVELAAAAGLAVGDGVQVDGLLLTSDPHISALGDCAQFPDPRLGRRVRLESVQAATDHARLIARRLCGKPVQPYDALPWFWSDQADWKLQIAGLALPDDDSLPGPGDSVLRLRGGRLVAVETINDPRTHMRARRLLAADGPPDAATALAPLTADNAPAEAALS